MQQQSSFVRASIYFLYNNSKLEICLPNAGNTCIEQASSRRIHPNFKKLARSTSSGELTMANSARLRTFWWTLHRWIGIALALLLVPIAVSGALLVWHDHLDALIHPGRYVVTGAQVVQPSKYLASAAAALDPGVAPAAVRFPADDGWPVIVMARGARTESGPPRIVNVYLDPPTARVLDVVDFRSSLIGFLHRFHENLTIPEYSGRAIVGWAGVGMLILSLTGIWLWWPRSGAFLPGLRWRRTAFTTTNLHHLVGFWISIPLAVVSFTGIYLGFPQTARQVMASIAPMTPQGQRPGFGAIARDARLTPEAALSAALTAQDGARAAVIFLPTANASGGERGRPVWRVQLRAAGSGETVTVLVDDRSGAVERMPEALAGDRAAQWMRWIHDGSRGGPVWQSAVFLTGVCPLVFAVTGVVMWWRGRRNRKELAVSRAASPGELQAAE
jgi:uncharacterized iron-regulated membrane protein